MSATNTGAGNGPAHKMAFLWLTHKNHQVKFLALVLCVIASLTALGFGMFWEGHPPNSIKNPSVIQAIPPQDVHQDPGAPQKLQPRDSSVSIGKQTLVSRPSPRLPKKTTRKKEKGKGKDAMSSSTHAGRNVTKSQGPQMLPPQTDAWRLSQGRSLVRTRLYLKAIEVLEPLFALPPKDWETWFWMGTAQMGLGRYEEAQKYFWEGLAREETIPELWVQCALAEHQRGKYSEAMSLLRQAERLAPTLPPVHLNLAFTLERQGDTSSALRHYRQYLSLTKGNHSYLSTRQKVLQRVLNLEPS